MGTAADAAESDRKLDTYVAAQRSNPNYADSFMPSRSPQERKPPLDMLNLSRDEFSAIANGKIRVGG